MHFYLTYNDAASGIYSSQVIDVVKFFNNELKINIKLVAFISIRNFLANRKKIKSELSQAIVLPMFPGVHRWQLNSYLLQLLIAIYKPHTIIGRSVFATQLALIAIQKNKVKKVVYDGRAAVKAEWEEYNVITNQDLLSSIFELEKQCVLQSDYRIAVSNSLVSYWQTQFNYNGSQHSVIPCTLNSLFESVTINQEIISEKRSLLRFETNDVIFVYSGSLAGWQSINVMVNFIKTILLQSKQHKILFLSEQDVIIQQLQTKFPNQVQCKKVMPNEVPHYLLACDYGLLIREKSITNKVASPVKFAEYLACGLDVIISEELGDYSEFVKQNNCGFVYNEIGQVQPISLQKKIINQQLTYSFFTKNTFKEHYSQLI